MTYSLPSRAYGRKVDIDEGYVRSAELARRIRADIKAAQKSGDLPADLTFAVRKEDFSGGRAVDVTIQGWPEAAYLEASTDEWGSPRSVLIHEAQAVKALVEALIAAHNWDGSDALVDYSDVRFYSHVTFETDAAREHREAKAAERRSKAVVR